MSGSVSNGGGRGGNDDSVRETLFGVLADCMRDAIDLMVMVLDGAGRLGQTVNPERFGYGDGNELAWFTCDLDKLRADVVVVSSRKCVIKFFPVLRKSTLLDGTATEAAPRYPLC